MNKPKTRAQEKLEDLNELLSYYSYPTKGETLASQNGLMMGWLARLASTDYIVDQELDARLYWARQKNSSKDTQ